MTKIKDWERFLCYGSIVYFGLLSARSDKDYAQ